MKLGFIGLGEMGLPMAENLVKNGYGLTVFDLAPEPLQRLKSIGATIASGPDEVAARSDFLMVIVRTPEQVRQVLFGTGGVVTGDKLPEAVAVMSTISPVDAVEMAAQAGEKGIGFMDAPVSGAQQRAESGELTVMIGGPEQLYGRFRPVFEVLGSNVFHIGDVGAGQYAKLINNMLLLVNMCAAHEAVSLTRAAGMDPKVVLDLIRVSTGQSWVVDNWETVDGWKQDYQPGETLDIIYKDIDITLGLGEKKKVPLHLSALAKQLVRY